MPFREPSSGGTTADRGCFRLNTAAGTFPLTFQPMAAPTAARLPLCVFAKPPRPKPCPRMASGGLKRAPALSADNPSEAWTGARLSCLRRKADRSCERSPCICGCADALVRSHVGFQVQASLKMHFEGCQRHALDQRLMPLRTTPGKDSAGSKHRR